MSMVSWNELSLSLCRGGLARAAGCPAEGAVSGAGKLARRVRASGQRKRPDGNAGTAPLVDSHALRHSRDVSSAEDASRVRCGHAPQTMAMLRNLAIPVLASLGHCRWSSEAIRWVSYEAFTRSLELIGLP